MESGTHKELLARDGLIARLYRMTYEQAERGGDGRCPSPACLPSPTGQAGVAPSVDQRGRLTGYVMRV